VNRMIVRTIPAQTIKRVVALGADVFVVAGSYETRLLRRGEQRTIRSLALSGRFRMDTIPRLEHSLLERTGREHVSDVVSEYLVRQFATAGSSSLSPGSDADS
jgi:hypothetical protein